MKRDQTDYAISLLVLWHRWESGYRHVEGYPTECPSTRGWRASNQYDDANGAQETDARGILAAHVGRLILGIDEPFRTALYVLARSRATGIAVWRSARLPDDKDICAEITAEGLARFEKLV